MGDYKKSDYKLYRCIFFNVGKEYIKARDYNCNSYDIKKSVETKNFKEGTDDEFYARMETKGIFKKKILHVIAFEDYLSLVD